MTQEPSALSDMESLLFSPNVSEVEELGIAQKHRHKRRRPAKDIDSTRPRRRRRRLVPATKSEGILQGEGSSEKGIDGEVGKDTQSKKPPSSLSAYAEAIVELWDTSMKQYEDRATKLQEQLWEQQEQSESLAGTYNTEIRAARQRIAELETENAVLEEKVGLTRKTMEGLKILMEL